MDFKAARRRMVDSQVRTNDVTDLRLQTALETVPREDFLPAELRDQAYVERELPYAPGRSLMTVRDFAKLAAAAQPATPPPFWRSSSTWWWLSKAMRRWPPPLRKT